MKVLYLSYDGALDPLGRSQIVPYLEGLARRGVRYDLVTFEKPRRWNDRAGREAMAARLEAAGVRWHPLPYHKRPPVLSTAYDLARGVRRAGRVLERGRGVDLVHARSYPPAAMARWIGRRHGLPWLFDMRGLWADERVDGGLWRSGGALYRGTKRLEGDLFAEAAGVVTLTRASVPAVEALLRGTGNPAPLRVIPTCVDLERFRVQGPPEGPPVLAYVGSVGTWYLLEPMLDLARVALERGTVARVLFLVNNGAEEVRRAAAGRGMGARLEVRTVGYEDVPRALAGVAATFFLIRPAPSKVASEATKLAESLAVGRPVLVNEGVGDAADVVREHRVGAVVGGFDPPAYDAALRELEELMGDPGTGARCRHVAESRYALQDGVDAYAELYREIAR